MNNLSSDISTASWGFCSLTDGLKVITVVAIVPLTLYWHCIPCSWYVVHVVCSTTLRVHSKLRKEKLYYRDDFVIIMITLQLQVGVVILLVFKDISFNSAFVNLITGEMQRIKALHFLLMVAGKQEEVDAHTVVYQF